MKKFVMSDGNSHKLRLNSEDMKIYELQEGDLLDVEIVKIKKHKGGQE